MATDIYSMLTGGYDPGAEQMKQQQAFQQQLGQATTPQAFLATVGSNMGNMLGQGVQKIAGVKDPREEKAIKKREALERVKASGVNTKDRVAFLSAVAQEFENSGLTAEALAVAEAVDKLKPTDDSMSLLKDFTAESVAKYKETKNVNDLVRYTKEEKAKTSPYAQQLIDEGLMPGSSEFIAVMGAYNKAELAGKAPKPKDKSPFEKQMDLAGITDPAKRQAMATRKLELDLRADRGDPTALAAIELFKKQLDVQILQNKLEQTKAEQTAATAAKVQGASAEAYKTNNILNTIDTAINQVGGSTAGLGGAIMSQIPGSEAVDLQENLLTIKANIGFNELSQMRKDSPTGGALGQVSDMENKALQAARASLEQRQSPDQLRTNLNKIKDSYDRWLKVITGEWTEADAQAYLDSLKGKEKRKETPVPNAEDSALINKYFKR
jgi:hypothetical protein